MKLGYLMLIASLLALQGGGVLDNDTDPDGDAVTGAILVTPPQYGVLEFNPDGTFVYTPDPGFHGTDGFQYRPIDEHGLEGNDTPVTIVVHSVNDPPLGVADEYETDEDTPLTVPSGPEWETSAFGGDVDYAPAGRGNEASWTFAITNAGTYRVSATWPVSSNAIATAMYTVVADDGLPVVTMVDQRRAPSDFQVNGTDWAVLATVLAETQILVRLSSVGDTGWLVADAVRIERISE